METFKIEIRELLSRTVDVQAGNLDEAVTIANKMYDEEEVVLDYDDLKIQDIIPYASISEKESLMKEVIDYFYSAEKKHFEQSDEPVDHIFLKLEKLKAIIY